MTDVFAGLKPPGADSMDNRGEGYEAYRHGAALVDYTGAGLLKIAGAGASPFISRIATRSVDFLLEGQISVALLLREDGTVVAEVLIYCLGSDYLVEFWPEQAEAGRQHVEAAAESVTGVAVEDLSGAYTVLGIEGPKAFRVAQHSLSFPIASMAFRSFAVPDGTGDLLLARIGVTGEYGYKLVVPVELAESRRAELRERGAEPAGREMLDVCRMETRFANIEAEGGGAPVTPFDLGIQWMVDFQNEFIGKTALLEHWEDDPSHRPVCWRADPGETTVPAHGTVVRLDGAEVGVVSHAVFSPSLGSTIGTARVRRHVAAPGLELEIGGTAVRTTSAPFLVATSFGVPLE